MMNGNDGVVGKRKSRLSPEHEQLLNKKFDSFSGDEAYCSISLNSYRGDDTDGSSCEDIVDIDEEETQEMITEPLRNQFKYIVAEMEPLGVIDHLHDSELFTDSFLEECKETPSRRRRNDLLIKEIHKIARNKDNVVLQLFNSALKETGQSHIVNQLKKQPSCVQEKLRYRRSSLTGFVRMMKDRLVDTIEPKDFIDDLLVSRAISFNDHEDIIQLHLRKQRVAVIMEKVEAKDTNYMEIINAIIKTYPKIFEEFERKTNYDPFEGGTAVSIKLNLKCRAGMYGGRDLLRKIEKRGVERFNNNPTENNEMIDELIEECRCIFERLKISSVIIQLLTREGDSLDKVLRKIQSGKAADWLLSILHENDKRMLLRMGVDTLQVSVSVDEDGNLSSLNRVKDCICLLDKQSIIVNKETLARRLTDTESLIHQMKSFRVPISQLRNLRMVKNKLNRNTIILDFIADADTPRVCCCLLEEHIKLRDPSFFESLFSNDISEDIELSTSDIKQNEDFLKDELEVQMLFPIIHSWESEKSTRLLAKLGRCSCRSSRMAELIRFLLCEKDVTWFWDQVREKQKYIWDTIASTKRTNSLPKRDVLAVQLMNDTVVDEINPFKLKQFMKGTTIFGLRFDEFEMIQSRKSQAQYMLNRITVDTIDDFMVALRRCGYERIYKQIKAGPFARSYVCPRIHSANSRAKLIYKNQFDILARLCVYENSDGWTDSVFTNQADVDHALHYSIRIVTPPVVGESLMFTKSGLGSSPVSVGSARDSESGIFSGSEGPSYEIANPHDFDDEGISSCSPRPSQEIDHLSDPNTETSETANKSYGSTKRERMLRLIDSDMSVSRGLLQRSRLISAPKLTSHNFMCEVLAEENMSDYSFDISSRSNRKTKYKGENNDDNVVTGRENGNETLKPSFGLRSHKGQFTLKDEQAWSEEFKSKASDVDGTNKPVRSSTQLHTCKDHDQDKMLALKNHGEQNSFVLNEQGSTEGYVPQVRKKGDERAISSPGKKTRKGKYTLREEVAFETQLAAFDLTKQSKRSSMQVLDCKDIKQENNQQLKKLDAWTHNRMGIKEESNTDDSIVSYIEHGDDGVISPREKKSEKGKYTFREREQAWSEAFEIKTPLYDVTKQPVRPSMQLLADKDSKQGEKEKRAFKKLNTLKQKSLVSKEGRAAYGDQSVISSLGRKSGKGKYTLRQEEQAWLESSKTKTPTLNGKLKMATHTLRSSYTKFASKESEQEMKRRLKKSGKETVSQLEGTDASDSPQTDQRKSNIVNRSLNDILESEKHLKYFSKPESKIALAEDFDTRCSMKHVHEESSVSSGPNGRGLCFHHVEAKRRKRLPHSVKRYRKPSTCEPPNDTD